MRNPLRSAWEQVSIYLPVILMGLLAMGTWWLVKNSPQPELPPSQRPAIHEVDYFMRRFSVKTFDADGRVRSEIYGAEARHYADTDTLEIDDARIRMYDKNRRLTVATARRALSNGDGSEVQLIGDARVLRDMRVGPGGLQEPRVEIRGEFLHAFVNDERLRSHKPVTLIRGGSQFVADSLAYDNLDSIVNLQGRVRGSIEARTR